MSANKPCVHYITITRNGILSLHDKATTEHLPRKLLHVCSLFCDREVHNSVSVKREHVEWRGV